MAGTILEQFPKDKLAGARVFLRLDLNVPLDAALNITDDSRIVAALATIRYLQDAGARIIIASHLGRPKAAVEDRYRLDPVAKRLSELLGSPVIKLDEAIGPKVQSVISQMQNSEICLLENIRFYAGEESNDPVFAQELASLADIYVNDAFGTAHRAHASTVGITKYLSPALPGFLMQKEIEMLGSRLQNPERPFTAIIGGSKISSKIKVIKSMLSKVDVLLIGGGMAYSFIKARGGRIGQSICENDQLDTAREIMTMADREGTALILPTDTLTVPALDAQGKTLDIFKSYGTNAKLETQIYPSNAIPDDMQGMDIGPESIKEFAKLVSQSRTVLWNGPLGVFEYDSLDKGTHAIALALRELTINGGTSIIGGGDSVAAIEKFSLAKSDFTHVSTGGGASLEFLESQTLPGIACLETGLNV